MSFLEKNKKNWGENLAKTKARFIFALAFKKASLAQSVRATDC